MLSGSGVRCSRRPFGSMPPADQQQPSHLDPRDTFEILTLFMASRPGLVANLMRHKPLSTLRSRWADWSERLTLPIYRAANRAASVAMPSGAPRLTKPSRP